MTTVEIEEVVVPDHMPPVCYAAQCEPSPCPSDGIAVWVVTTMSLCRHFLCDPCKKRWQDYGNIVAAVRL